LNPQATINNGIITSWSKGYIQDMKWCCIIWFWCSLNCLA